MNDWMIRILIVLLTLPTVFAFMVYYMAVGLKEGVAEIRAAWKHPQGTRFGKKHK